jgi:hypothetical protein
MAIDRYQKPEILTDVKTPVDSVAVYSFLDSARLSKTPLVLTQELLNQSYVHKHIYSENNLLHSSVSPLQYEVTSEDKANYTYDILLTPEKDVRKADVPRGTYNIVYNFLKTFSSELKIKNISADSTEIELEVDNSNYSLKKLYDLVNSGKNYKDNLVLNFGKNNLFTITDISFANNEVIGEQQRWPKHPLGKYNGRDVTYFPSEEDGDKNIWIEVYKQTRLTTGRATSFTPIVDEKTRDIKFEPLRDVNGTQIFFSKNSQEFDRRYEIESGLRVPDDIFDNIYYGTHPFSKFKIFNPYTAASNKIKNVVVKLYTELPVEFENKIPKISLSLREDYIERVLVYPYIKEETYEDFSYANFNIDMGNYGKSQGTDLKTWNSLLDTTLSTSQQIVDKYLSGSIGNTTLNIDYSNFKNFVNYSSAVERVKNLKYKLELIESYDSRINTLNLISGSSALTNISQSLQRKSNVISGMDGWEKWMYYETTGSLYTHYSASSYVINPWPHYDEFPKKLYSVTSSQAISHYNGLIDSASIYDTFNDARLTKTIPSSMAEDPLNLDYILFIDMIGHHFDITWSYIKALTSINEREEHPYDGMPNELLYDVAKSMGWKLTHGKDRSDLWKFAAGTDKFGNYAQTGSLQTKTDEQINYEVWRRIVNNIPYLLKTKGSARAVKALIATYGIPQSFLSIREYGGPAIEDKRHIWEHDRFVYHLRMDTDNYITAPWDKIADIDPQTYLNRDPNPIDTIEIQFQQNLIRTSSLLHKGSDFAVLLEPTSRTSGKGNIHLYLSGSNGYKSASIENVPVFDSKMGTLLVQRETSVDDITQNNEYKIQYRKNRKDRISTSKSASIDINGSTESSYNAAWTGSGTVTFSNTLPTSNTPSIWADAEYMSGSIQEIRYWAQPLKDIVVDEHTLSRESYHGNSATSSYFDLKFRFIPDSQLKNVSESYDGILSQHPNQRISGSESGYILSASLFSFESDDLRGVTEEYYTKVPSAGANNIMNNKVRVESNRLTGILDPEQKKEKSQYDSAPVDSNQVGVYMSATKMYNEDIYNHTGYFEIDDYIGNPDRRPGYTEQNEELDYVRRQVFKKYSSKNLINDTIDILARYDFSVFEQIRQTMPARVDYNSGILIEPHILERPKVKSKTNLSYTQPQYDVVITNEVPVISEYIHYDTIITAPRSESAEYIHYDTVITAPRSESADYILYETTIPHQTLVVATKHDYTSSIDTTELRNIIAQKDDVESVGNPTIRNMYSPSTYRYTILNYSASADIGFGSGWTTGSNGYWNYNVTSSNAVVGKPSKYALKTIYFYNTELSASLRLSNSSSLVPASVSTDELPLSLENLRYLGCKMTSDSLTTNSPDTPDGRPVIEIFEADPNVLIYTSQTAEEGNLDVDTSTNLPTLKLEDLKVNDDIKWSREQEYKEAVAKFRKEIEKLIQIEGGRRTEFDLRYEEERIRFELEQQRREEFDIINRPNRITDV